MYSPMRLFGCLILSLTSCTSSDIGIKPESHVAPTVSGRYSCQDPSKHAGKIIGDGQCVAFVRSCSGAPPSSQWREGSRVRGAGLSSGTAIATFVNGKYPDENTGQHAAIYIKQDTMGIEVWDQWVGQPVHKRVIQFKGGQGSRSNDGDAFSVIE